MNMHDNYKSGKHILLEKWFIVIFIIQGVVNSIYMINVVFTNTVNWYIYIIDIIDKKPNHGEKHVYYINFMLDIH